MTYNFCTLFDKNYIFRGLAMYNSLKVNCQDFKLWILCMDEATYEQLKKMNLLFVELIKLSDFELNDNELLAIKPSRTVVEYCWTISSSLPLYIFKHYPQLDNLAYLDSDLYFFSSPAVIYKEMGNNSIAIVRHNYSKELIYLEEKSGVYNVSMVVFKNDKKAMDCLLWWRVKCLEWCFAYYEDGKLGDQMYLNDWTDRFEGVCVIKNKGVNLAPWNLNKYSLKKVGQKIFVDEDELVFYHYHSLKMYKDGNFQLYYSSYLVSKYDEGLVYPPYLNEINLLVEKFKIDTPKYPFGFNEKPGIIYRVKLALKARLSILFYLKSLYNL